MQYKQMYLVFVFVGNYCFVLFVPYPVFFSEKNDRNYSQLLGVPLALFGLLGGDV